MLDFLISSFILSIHTLYTLTYDVQVVFCWGQTYKCFFFWDLDFFSKSYFTPLPKAIFPPDKWQGINFHLLLHNYLYLILFNSSGVVFCWGQTYKCVFFLRSWFFFSKSHFTPLPKDISPPIKGRAFGKEGNYGVKTKMEPPPTILNSSPIPLNCRTPSKTAVNSKKKIAVPQPKKWLP